VGSRLGRSALDPHGTVFKRILTVCVGNICRSPMAAALFSERLRSGGANATVESAGIAALVGKPADPIAQELMRERGLDISAHRARQLTPEIIRSFELILVMEAEQQRAVESILSSARGRVHRIGRWGDFDVPDPYRRGRGEFERALDLISRGVDDFEKAFWPRRT
jgi:protein-tyrosine phosphatase